MRPHRVAVCLAGLLSGLLALAAPAAAQLTVTTAPTGLEASYAMSNGVDWSGHGRTAVFTNTTVAPGKYADAQQFNGVSARATIPTFPLTTAFTVEAWLYLDPQPQTRAVAAPRGGPSTWQALVYKGPDNVFLAEVGGFLTVGFRTPAGVVQLVNATRSAPSAWHHVAAVYDGALVRLIVDGLQTAAQAITGPVVPSGQPWELGGSAADLGYLAGRVDDVRIYARALTIPEIVGDMATPVDTVREPVLSWDLEIWPAGTPIPATGAPSTGPVGFLNVAKSGALCNLAPRLPPTAPVVNPTTARVTDPDLPTRECEIVIQSFITTIPVGLAYIASLRAKGATASSDRSGASNAFDRVAEVVPPLPAPPPVLR